MAISSFGGNDNQQPNTTSNTSTVSQSAPLGINSSPFQQHADGTFSWLNIGGVSEFALDTNPSSEVVSALREAFEGFTKTPPKGMEVDVFVLDNNNYPDLYYSVVVMAARITALPEKPVAYHFYLVEATGTPLEITTKTVDHENVEIMPLASDAYDAVVRELVLREIRARYQGVPHLETSAEVIPASFDVKSNPHVWAIYCSGIAAIRQIVDFKYNQKRLNIAAARKDAYLAVVARRNFDRVTGVDGLPVRADILVDLVARARKKDDTQSLNKSVSSPLSRACGYIDFAWAKEPTAPVQQQMMMDANGQLVPVMIPQQTPKLYVPVFVLTSVQSYELQSMEAQLMGLLGPALLMENNNWTFGNFPRKGVSKGKQKRQLRDLSAIGLDIEKNADGTGVRLSDIGTEGYTMGMHKAFMESICKGLVIAMDVPECGSATWQYSVFVAAANGNAAATQQIIDAADNLLNGHFSKFFKEGSKIAEDWGGRIHGGYYLDEDREKADIRDVDYLTVLNMFGDNDMNVVRSYSDSYNKVTIPLPIRMQKRKQIIDNLSPVYTQYMRRVVFSGEFLNALKQAAKACGMTMSPELPYTETTTDIRAVAGFATAPFVMQPMMTGLYQSNSAGAVFSTGPAAFTGYVNGTAFYQG